MRPVRAIVGLGAVLAAAGCGDGTAGPEPCDPGPVEVVCVGPHAVIVEIAATASERSRGLAFRDSLPDGHGMLFVFDEAGDHLFWMDDTTIPLSIAFMDADAIVLNIEEMEPLTLETHGPAGPALYALEVNQGWFAERGVAVGDTVRLGASAGPF
ncbi:MAG: DUF192 domain-containing protein [Gemmatimonadota bacterium]